MIGRITSSTMTQQSLRTLQSNLVDRERLHFFDPETNLAIRS